MNLENFDPKVVQHFGEEWSKFDQFEMPDHEMRVLFSRYFAIFPWHAVPENARGFDLGCGSGRWASLVAPRVGELHCIDPSAAALAVARQRLARVSNCVFHEASVDAIPLADNSMDFGYSLGVLHHVPRTEEGLKACVAKIKPGAPMLVYLYYALEQKSALYRSLWRLSNILRRRISEWPRGTKYGVSQIIAVTTYYPLARVARICEKIGLNVENIPLSDYRDKSFYTMRTDALDRFGTRIEQRFTRDEITAMMQNVGLSDIRFAKGPPYWCAVGFKT